MIPSSQAVPSLRGALPLALAVVCAAALALIATGCGEREDPILRLSAEESLTLGKQFLEQEKYARARRHLIHAFEVEPNSRSGREALLLAADALYLQGSTENYIKCEAKYRDFLNRFPTSDRSDYAQFKVAECLAARVERPDRDQEVTLDALEAYEELLRLYPDSEYLPEARQRMREMNDQLAAHELVVGSFYNRYGGTGICKAAIARLEYLQNNYPQFAEMDQALYNLVVAYSRCGDFEKAEESLADLRRRYPDSEFLGEAKSWEENKIPDLRRLWEEEEARRAALEALRAARTGTATKDTADAGEGSDEGSRR
ncbi:MAG: outer membrane protein assembly factor BamD [Thermoanaerobaculia bacterium]|nr:outer membrane protein assembly factor BamD [Thermoanaerobaculia bacterium]